MTYEPRPGWAGRALIVILLVGFVLRVLPLLERTPLEIIGGDSREYIQLAEFLLDSDRSPPGNRFPGFSLLLAGLFLLLPFAPETISIATCLVASIVFLVLLHALVRRLAGATLALLVTLMAALHPTIVDNAHRGLSEEFFLVTFVGVLLFYWRLRDTRTLPAIDVAGLLAVSAVMSITRPDAAYVMPLLAASLWWIHRAAPRAQTLALLLPVAIVPMVLPKLSQMWLVNLGIEPLDLRVGRAGLWMEFMLGRMPNQYMFYTQTTISEWIFGYHTHLELVTIACKSILRQGLSLGESIGGQLAMALALVGAVVHLRTHRDLLMPLAIPLATMPQWALVSLWPDADVHRYNLRILFLLLLFLALGARWLAERVATSVPAAGRERSMLAIIALLAIAPSFLPISVYGGVRPHVDILMHERTEWLPKVSETHERLTNLLTRRRDGDESADLVPAVRELTRFHDGYAPGFYTLGIFHIPQQDLEGARENLKRAVELVPFFAEAASLLAELYLVDNRTEDARALLDSTLALRPDHPLLRLESGHLHLAERQFEQALAAYEEYNRLNRYQFDRALFREDRIRRRHEIEDDFVDSLRTETSPEAAGLTSSFTWSYLSLDLDGLELPMPDDEDTYFNMGVCALYLDRAETAVHHFKTAVQLFPEDADAWHNLGRLASLTGDEEEARRLWREALKARTGHRLALDALRKSLAGDTNPDDDFFAPPRIKLPLTGVGYTTSARD